MIVQFPNKMRPDPHASQRHQIAELFFSFWFWWLPQPSHTVINLDDYRALKERRRINAAKRAAHR